MLDEINIKLQEQGIVIETSEETKEKLVELGYDANMGARPLRRIIQEYIEDGIADCYLDNPNAKILSANLVDDKITITEQINQ